MLGKTVWDGSRRAGYCSMLMCAERGDSDSVADRLLAKILKLRIFADDAGKMNRSVQVTSAAACSSSASSRWRPM